VTRSLLIVGALTLGCRPTSTPTDASPPDEAATGEPPAARDGPGTRLDATVPLLDGGGMSLEELRGQVVVLAMVLTSAESFPALAEGLQALLDAHADDVTLVLVAADQNPDAAVRDWPREVVLGFDPQGALATRLQVRTLPVVYVVDRKGRVVDVRGGDVASLLPPIRAATWAATRAATRPAVTQ
jgi:hypothetical protein